MRRDEAEGAEESRDMYHPSRRSCSEADELRRMPSSPLAQNVKKKLSKQLSMCETRRDIAWERRRRQILKQEQKRQALNDLEELHLTDEDLHELKGCIELGFGFDEESGQRLSNTIPAIDLYLSVHRRAVASHHASTLKTHVSASALPDLMMDERSPMTPKSPSSSSSSESWNICSPGDDPQLVKTKLRHWAQAVGCSVRQSY
ncbi:unnamed protein product [Rhodiola kirilowii]